MNRILHPFLRIVIMLALIQGMFVYIGEIDATDAISPPLVQEWNFSIAGPYEDYYNVGYDVKQTRDGGYIAVGFQGRMTDKDFNEIGYYCTDSPSSCSRLWSSSVWLVKISNNGQEIWDKTFPAGGNSFGFSVDETPDGGYIIAGSPRIIKVNREGNQEWMNEFVIFSSDSILATPDEKYILKRDSGKSILSTRGIEESVSKCSGTDTEIEDGYNLCLSHGILTKFYNDHPIGNVNSVTGSDMQKTMDGNFIILGSENIIYPFKTYRYPALKKIDHSGNILWRNRLNVTYSQNVKLLQTPDRGFLVLTNSYPLDVDPGDSAGGFRMNMTRIDFLKTDSSGNIQWAYPSPSRGETEISTQSTFRMTNDGGVVMTGWRGFPRPQLTVTKLKVATDQPVIIPRSTISEIPTTKISTNPPIGQTTTAISEKTVASPSSPPNDNIQGIESVAIPSPTKSGLDGIIVIFSLLFGMCFKMRK